MAMKSKDLAELLGVSTATMSLVLNNKAGISDELRATLLAKVRELGYGYMIKGESRFGENDAQLKKIAYVIYAREEEKEEESAFFPPILEGVEREARSLGYQLLVLHMDLKRQEASLKSLCEDCDGIVVQAPQLKETELEELAETGLPFVTVGCFLPEGGITSVSINNEQGMYKAVRYLKERGHSRIGYVRTASAQCSIRERHRYFKLAMMEEGLACRPEWDILIPENEAGSLSGGTSLFLEDLWGMQKKEMPTAFILENDILGPVVYRALRRAGRKVPQDVSVIGFDGRAICSMMDPTLTTLRVPRRFYGRALMMLLAQKMQLHAGRMENVSVRILVDVELVEMESVADCREGNSPDLSAAGGCKMNGNSATNRIFR